MKISSFLFDSEYQPKPVGDLVKIEELPMTGIELELWNLEPGALVTSVLDLDEGL